MGRFDGWREPKAAVADKPAKVTKSKYGNKGVTVDGIKFPSKLEARQYGKLKLLKMSGEVSSFGMQVNFPLHINGQLITTYRADFVVYYPDGRTEVQDAKGYPTPEYKIKKKLMAAIHNIEIIEIRQKK